MGVTPDQIKEALAGIDRDPDSDLTSGEYFARAYEEGASGYDLFPEELEQIVERILELMEIVRQTALIQPYEDPDTPVEADETETIG